MGEKVRWVPPMDDRVRLSHLAEPLPVPNPLDFDIKAQGFYRCQLATVCSWCNRHLSGPPDSPDVSHGICEDCRKEHFPNAGEKR